MKFENGTWLFQRGITAYRPKAVYEQYMEKEKFVLVCPTHHLHHKGDTLGGVLLTIKISAPVQNTFRVEVSHYSGVIDRGPQFELNISNDQPAMDVQETEFGWSLTSGAAHLDISKEQFTMTLYRDDKYVTSFGPNDISYYKENDQGHFYSAHNTAYMTARTNLAVDEYIYGMGERFGPLVKNGQTVVITNEDAGTSSDQAYKNVPFYLSSKSYGLFVNHSETVEFEVATEQVSKTSFSVKGESLDFFLIAGSSMKNVLELYTDLTGKANLPPEWSFGLWLSTSFTTNYDEETVMHFVDGMLEREIPLSVFHFDCFWMKGFHWTDFQFDKETFKDPKALIQKLHDKGLKTCVWINPYIAQQSILFEEAKENDYLLKRCNGDVWQCDMWQPGMGIVDFTNPAAVEWYQKHLSDLLAMGVDSFKTDFGERIPVEDVQWFDGSNPEKMHNYYAYLYNKYVFEVLEKERGAEEAVLFARTATATCQKYPVHWGGDCWSSYEGMLQSLRGGLSLTSSGFGFWSHDIGGFEATPSPDIYKRWVAFGLLSTHSRLHGSTSYRVPWAFDEEASEVLKYFSELKQSLLPTLYTEAYETSQTGIPMMRSLALEFPEDRNCAFIERQYMLGQNMMIAPIFNSEGIAEYYLPEGNWVNYFTHEKVEGGIWRKETLDYFAIPFWVKEGAVIVHSQKEDKESENESLNFVVFGTLDEDKKVQVYKDKKLLDFTIKKDDLRIEAEGDCSYQISCKQV